MSRKIRYRAVLRASLHGRFDEAKDKGANLANVTWDNSTMLLAAAFYMAAEKRFAADSSRDAVAAFIKECGEAFEDGSVEFRPLIWEGLVRGVLGEDELLQEIAPEDAMPAQMGLTYKMVKDLGMDQSQIDQLLDDAEELSQQWARESLAVSFTSTQSPPPELPLRLFLRHTATSTHWPGPLSLLVLLRQVRGSVSVLIDCMLRRFVQEGYFDAVGSAAAARTGALAPGSGVSVGFHRWVSVGFCAAARLQRSFHPGLGCGCSCAMSLRLLRCLWMSAGSLYVL
ncbi:MAG TPA: hypothetical protein VE172_19920 [Stackebrandtia sp.]|nr:hypothetical protein [Stackebrandtia sp.]HZE41073.1 hypothetical protein [Stackebrandtia sp.]